ncbi:MAG: response regulator [Pseudomonadota bacterium]
MRIYTVDDDDAVRRSSTILLRAHGYDAVSCASAELFLRSFDRSRAACVLLDIRMPGMNGLDLQSHLKAEGCDIPIIILTGHGDVPAAVRALKNGAIDFIEKPANEHQLMAALDQAREYIRSGPPRPRPDKEVQQRLAKLTAREREVLDHLVLGRINKEIAMTLGISQRTVEIHRARIREKMQARGLSDLIMMMR